MRELSLQERLGHASPESVKVYTPGQRRSRAGGLRERAGDPEVTTAPLRPEVQGEVEFLQFTGSSGMLSHPVRQGLRGRRRERLALQQRGP
jgi:hypothetical protein